jgi:hypothetical protein
LYLAHEPMNGAGAKLVRMLRKLEATPLGASPSRALSV